MNKDEAIALMETHRIKRRHNSALELWCFEYELLAFANACEKIGMEKAAKTVDHILKEGGGTYGEYIRKVIE